MLLPCDWSVWSGGYRAAANGGDVTTKTFNAIDEMSEALQRAEITRDARLNGAHLAEIEEEANNVLDLIIALRVAARENDTEAGQEVLAELVVALEHLVDHARFLLPSLKTQLDLEDEEATTLETQ